MSAILELPEVRARAYRLSVEAYQTLTELGAVGAKTELLRGLIVEKMSKSPLHSKLSERLFFQLLSAGREGLVIFAERPLRLADSVPEPDVMVVEGVRSDFDERHPMTAVLVAEIAVSSATLDRESASLYAEAGVAEYWIVLGSERQVEVYRKPTSSGYQQKHLYAADEVLTSESVPGFRMALADLFF